MSDSSLSWGRVPEPPKHRLPPRRVLALLAFAVVALLVIRTTMDHRPQWGGPAEPTAGELSVVLAQYASSLNNHDLERFDRTVDTTRAQFALCQQQLFDLAVRTGARVAGRYSVGRVDHWGDYVRAFADDGRGMLRLYFRRDEDRWKLTEPLLSEIGQERSKPFGDITVSSWELDADLADIVGEAADKIRQFAVSQGGPPPDHPFAIRIAPIQALGPRCGFAGQAARDASPSVTRIVIREVRLNAQYDGLAPDTSGVLEHEALHWLQRERSASAMQTMPWWMVEGWPESRAHPDRATRVRKALCATPALTIAELSHGPSLSEQPEVVDREYGIAAALVVLLDSRYGSDMYWRLFDAFSKEPDASKVFASNGVSQAGLFDEVVAKAACN